MWEITLIGKHKDVIHFLEMKNVLKDIFKSDVIIVITFNKDLICSIAINKKYKHIVQDLIYETIIKIAKSEYIEEHLDIWSEDNSLNSFILSTITMIDLNHDIDFAKSTAKLTKNLVIRSYVNFKLSGLVNIWKKICKFISNNFKNSEDKLYIELLKFFAENSNMNLDILYLDRDDKELILLDKNNKKLKSIDYLDEIGIIASLVMFAPKKLIINCRDKLSDKVNDLISYIFENRVSIIL